MTEGIRKIKNGIGRVAASSEKDLRFPGARTHEILLQGKAQADGEGVFRTGGDAFQAADTSPFGNAAFHGAHGAEPAAEVTAVAGVRALDRRAHPAAQGGEEVGEGIFRRARKGEDREGLRALCPFRQGQKRGGVEGKIGRFSL